MYSQPSTSRIISDRIGPRQYNCSDSPSSTPFSLHKPLTSTFQSSGNHSHPSLSANTFASTSLSSSPLGRPVSSTLFHRHSSPSATSEILIHARRSPCRRNRADQLVVGIGPLKEEGDEASFGSSLSFSQTYTCEILWLLYLSGSLSVRIHFSRTDLVLRIDGCRGRERSQGVKLGWKARGGRRPSGRMTYGISQDGARGRNNVGGRRSRMMWVWVSGKEVGDEVLGDCRLLNMGAR